MRGRFPLGALRIYGPPRLVARAFDPLYLGVCGRCSRTGKFEAGARAEEVTPKRPFSIYLHGGSSMSATIVPTDGHNRYRLKTVPSVLKVNHHWQMKFHQNANVEALLQKNSCLFIAFPISYAESSLTIKPGLYFDLLGTNYQVV